MKTDTKNPKGKKTSGSTKAKKEKLTATKVHARSDTKEPEVQIVDKEKKNKYEAKMVVMVNEVESKITKLNNEDRKFQDEANEKFEEEIEFLTEKKLELEHVLHKIKISSSEKWQHFIKSAEEKIEAFEEEAKDVLEGIKNGLDHFFSKNKK
jgi:hypothetical protein